MKTVLIVGGSHFKYWKIALDEAGFKTTHVKLADEAIVAIQQAMVQQAGGSFDVVLIQLYTEGGFSYPVKVPGEQGDLTLGAVFIKVMSPLHPKIKFLLLSGNKQSLIKQGKNVVFLPDATGLDLKDVVEHVHKVTSTG